MSAVRDALHKAARGENLSEQEAAAAMREILRGESSPALISGLLVALRMKGETVDEVVGFAWAMRAAAAKVTSPGIDPTRLVDTCGTGGDGLHTFNISTVAAFVVAGAGVAVAKHGNRSISSRCGSADVLEALGANVNLPPERIAESIEKVGFGFLFAPAVHPAMKHAGPTRREIGVRTAFNLLGPLTNPAGTTRQVLGVGDEAIATRIAEVAQLLGTERTFEGRLSGGFAYGAVRTPTRSGTDTANLSLLAAAGELQQAAAADPSATNLHAWGVAQLLLADYDNALVNLRDAAALLRRQSDAAQEAFLLSLHLGEFVRRLDPGEDRPGLATAEAVETVDRDVERGAAAGFAERGGHVPRRALLDVADEAQGDVVVLGLDPAGAGEAAPQHSELLAHRCGDFESGEQAWHGHPPGP